MLDKRIVKFIERHHVMTLATVGEGSVPYCSNIFYAFDSEQCCFVFSSSRETTHGQQMMQNPQVAASVVLESRVVGKLQGAQIVGRVVAASDADRKLYLSKFPYAIAVELTLWRMELDLVKFTDNKLGFGKKLIWKREE